ncbi:hypothetical protein A2115_00945 [Candidatus Woesebacteria bacterium GWA1_41_8]|uniref:Uncharacterized protein n=1 Tax=Candidatus Woesebacteria bacterium GWA1_41_8 TaxID=1802471 RepID=A0A1F7WIA5_9BACT|nr:MAG: hypothetical protein A2115_00945 [Candidatus Woesebacteria bacterium GWA1_41_8]
MRTRGPVGRIKHNLTVKRRLGGTKERVNVSLGETTLPPWARCVWRRTKLGGGSPPKDKKQNPTYKKSQEKK